MNALSPAFPAGALANAGEARLCEMVFPEQANHYGTLFGGTALSLMGKAAFVAASRHARARDAGGAHFHDGGGGNDRRGTDERRARAGGTRSFRDGVRG